MTGHAFCRRAETINGERTSLAMETIDILTDEDAIEQLRRSIKGVKVGKANPVETG